MASRTGCGDINYIIIACLITVRIRYKALSLWALCTLGHHALLRTRTYQTGYDFEYKNGTEDFTIQMVGNNLFSSHNYCKK